MVFHNSLPLLYIAWLRVYTYSAVNWLIPKMPSVNRKKQNGWSECFCFWKETHVWPTTVIMARGFFFKHKNNRSCYAICVCVCAFKDHFSFTFCFEARDKMNSEGIFTNESSYFKNTCVRYHLSFTIVIPNT